MDARGRLCFQRASDKRGKEFTIGPEYRRSNSLRHVEVPVSLDEKVTWVDTDEVNSGYLEFDPSEDSAIKVCRCHGARFTAYTLMKVDNDPDADRACKVDTSFYPPLHKMLKEKKNWGKDFAFRGRASFQYGILEWTQSILVDYGRVLHEANIYGAVGVSPYPYEVEADVWRVFCELWGPLTNTLHHGNGEMGISLYDMKVIGGLPILGEPYEEFIPSNQKLFPSNSSQAIRYPSTLVELLCIHARLCDHYKSSKITWTQWINHFYRGKFMYGAFGGHKKANPIPLRVSKSNGRGLPLTISKEGALAAFLALWLSRFVFPSETATVRPETFYMACLMAHGTRVSLAPAALGYIYHGLGEMASHPKGPGASNACLPIHYLIGWLGEHFPSLYKTRPSSDFSEGYPLLARYSGVEPQQMSIYEARLLFRSDRGVDYRPHSFPQDKDTTYSDDGSLSEELFELLVCMRSSTLPIRIGDNLWLEPYYPNRFSRQFGLDQGVPSNRLSFALPQRRQCGVEDLAKAQARLLRADTGALFFVPGISRRGTCSWTYCSWWVRSSIPYLSPSVKKVHVTLTGRRLDKKRPIFVISSLREEVTGLAKEVPFTGVGVEPSASVSGDGEKRPAASQASENEKDYKRARYNRDDHSDEAKSDDFISPSEVIEPVLTSSLLENDPVLADGTEAGLDLDVSFQDEPDVDCDTTNTNEIPLTLDTIQVGTPNDSVADFVVEEEQVDYGSPGGAMTVEPGNESIPPMTCEFTEAFSKFSFTSMFSSTVNGRAKDFAMVLIEDILRLISSSNSLLDVLSHRSTIDDLIGHLNDVVRRVNSGKAEMDWFSSVIAQIFELAEKFSSDTTIIAQEADVDIYLIRDLIRQHEECMVQKQKLSSDLVDSSKKFDNLKYRELEVTAAEQKARAMRNEFESDKRDLEEQIGCLRDSLLETDQLAQKLQDSKADANIEKFQAIEHAKDSNKSRDETFRELVQSLVSFQK